MDKQYGVITEQRLCDPCVSLSALPRHARIQTHGDNSTSGSLQVFTKAGGSPLTNFTLPGAAQS